MSRDLLQKLRDDRRLCDALEESFDFIVQPPTYDISWCQIEPADRVEPIASDASGGTFILYGPDEWVIHVTSEGQGGVVARDLREFLTILVTFPYWLDLLKFSGGGKLEEMRASVPLLEEESGEYTPNLERHRHLLIEQLGLRKDPGIVTALHDAVRDLGQSIRIVAPDGSEYDSLFNTFSSAQLQANRLRKQPIRRTGPTNVFGVIRNWFRRGPG